MYIKLRFLFDVCTTDHPWIQNAKKAPNVSLGENVKARLKQFSFMNKLKKRALQVTKSWKHLRFWVYHKILFLFILKFMDL